MAIKYSIDDIKHMSYFEKITRSKVKDCFSDSNGLLTFVVSPGEIIKAIGKGASNVKKLELKLAKKIRVIEFSDTLAGFVKNVLHPYKAREIVIEENIVKVHPVDIKTRGYMIGKSGTTLRNNEAIVKRYYKDVAEIKIMPLENKNQY